MELKTRQEFVIANFMCQLNWDIWCPDIWGNIILDVSMGVFLDEINIWIVRLSKEDCPSYSAWPSSNLQKAWLEQKAK